MTSIGIIGYGHVGRVTNMIFPSALVYDKYKPELMGEWTAVARCDIGFVCVPTPPSHGGGADLSEVWESVDRLECEIIVIRSTVPPGTISALKRVTGKRVVYFPEYIGESEYYENHLKDPLAWPFCIVGGDSADTRHLVALLARALGPNKTYRQLPAEAAELAKYMENTWLATQVCFAWQFKLLAESFGVDYWETREAWALDPRVSKTHTAVFDSNPGYGGKCLPKDVRAILSAGRDAGASTTFLESLVKFNDTLRNC